MDLISRITDYVYAVRCNELHKVTKESVKEIILLIFLDDMVNEVLTEYQEKGYNKGGEI